jgi:hypothetical protein
VIGHELLKTGLQVSFRVVEEEVLAALDEAEFGMRLLLKFVAPEGEDDQDEDRVAEETVEWGAFGFIFTLGAFSFEKAKPRNKSSVLTPDQPVNALEARAFDNTVVSRCVLDQPVASVTTQDIAGGRSSHSEGLLHALGHHE